jgi:hypothetical protein
MNNENSITKSDPVVAPGVGTGFQGDKILYGLPCANCRSYFESALTACPICHCSERVSPHGPFTRLAEIL